MKDKEWEEDIKRDAEVDKITYQEMDWFSDPATVLSITQNDKERGPLKIFHGITGKRIQ